MTALTPDDLARIEERQRIFRLRGLHVDELIELDVPALVAGVRSRDERIAELEAEATTRAANLVEDLARMWSDASEDEEEFAVHVWLNLAASRTRIGGTVGDAAFNTEWHRLMGDHHRQAGADHE